MTDTTTDIQNEFPYECGCGEQYRNANSAWSCRKCRDYLTDEDFFERKVVDLRTGQTVLRVDVW